MSVRLLELEPVERRREAGGRVAVQDAVHADADPDGGVRVVGAGQVRPVAVHLGPVEVLAVEQHAVQELREDDDVHVVVEVVVDVQQ